MNDTTATLLLEDLVIDPEKGFSRRWAKTLRSLGRVATDGLKQVDSIRKAAINSLDKLVEVFYPKQNGLKSNTEVKIRMSRHPDLPTAVISRSEDGGHRVVFEKEGSEQTIFSRHLNQEYFVDTRGDGSLVAYKDLPYKTQITLSLLAMAVGRTYVAKRINAAK